MRQRRPLSLVAAFFMAWAGLNSMLYTSEGAPAERLKIVTTLFPLYDWARVVGGELVEVRLLLPPGAEAHTYAPRPSDILATRQADLFVFLHPAMEPWAADLLAGAIRPGLRILELAQNVALMGSQSHHAETEHLADEADPHVWLDPLRAAQMVRELANVLAELAPAHRDIFMANADQYCARLQELDQHIRTSLASCQRRTVIFAGHNAFRYFADRYGLTFLSPYAGFSPDAAPSPRALAALAAAVRETGSPIIFHEELVTPRVAQTIARETGAQLEMLHAIHNLSEQDFRSGVTYVSLMEENLRKLKEALDCR